MIPYKWHEFRAHAQSPVTVGQTHSASSDSSSVRGGPSGGWTMSNDFRPLGPKSTVTEIITSV